MEVNYLAEIIAFERWLETNYLPISSQLLWYKIMNLFNRSGWSEWVIVDNLRLMAAMQMGREATLIKARDELIKAGRISYQKGRKGSPNRYKMVYFTCKREVENVVERVVQSGVYPVVQSVVESADIYKQKQNKTKKKDTKVSTEKSYRFEPPSVENVMGYCQEKGYETVDAERFVDFYASKGWYVGKNKMKDWKAAVRNWAKQETEKKKQNPSNNQKPSNQFQQFPQREVDYDALVLLDMQGGDQPPI